MKNSILSSTTTSNIEWEEKSRKVKSEEMFEEIIKIKIDSKQISAIGNPDILNDEKTAFFCSRKCSGRAILKVFETARIWQAEQKTIISGFHSPLEQEVLQILLKGKNRIIICPARSLEKMRVALELKKALTKNRLLIISPFTEQHRQTKSLALKRNNFIVQIADKVMIADYSKGGNTEKLILEIERIGKSFDRL
jgi:predicted Rossmann fold nucleotide-binding protein DprA/Smf involved in DNA uptake